MIRDVEVRCIVQNKPNSMNFSNIYYPQVISASTSDEIPFAVPTATIEIVSNNANGTDTYVSPIHEDDIVSLQVSEKVNYWDQKNWQEIFSGRIREMKTSSGSRNTTTLYCVGHMEEMEWSLIQETKTWTTTTDALTIMVAAVVKARRQMQFYSQYCNYGVVVPTYEITAYQNHMSDLITDMEKISGNKWYADCFPIYDRNHVLLDVYFTWKPISTTVTDQYKVIENSGRYIESDFNSSIEELYTSYRVQGDKPADTTTTEGASVTQNAAYVGTATDATAAVYYGLRMKTDTYTWIKSNTTAQAIADGVLPDMCQPTISGSIKLVLTPQAHKGDLVYISLPSTEVNGKTVVGNYVVSRVEHNISSSECSTNLQIGHKMNDAYDYIGKIIKVVNILKKNMARG